MKDAATQTDTASGRATAYPSGPGMVVFAVAAMAGLVGALGVIGTDAFWLVPLGHEVAHGHIPSSVTFATAPSSGWHNVPAAAELLFWALYRLLGGARGLVIAQTAAAAVGFGALAWGIRREASDRTTLAIGGVVILGALPAVVVTGVSLFSLALFPVLLGLLEAETAHRAAGSGWPCRCSWCGGTCTGPRSWGWRSSPATSSSNERGAPGRSRSESSWRAPSHCS